jgi:DNA-binding NtrC family response regulator
MAEVDVLVVETERRRRGKTAFWLRAEGYRVDVADSFEQAREKIDISTPACLITSVKLGIYNGLHLIARTRCSHSSVAFVLMHDVSDPVLESEAHSHDSEFLVVPCHQDELLDAVRQSFLTARKSADEGFSQRKVVAGEEFQIATALAALAKR